MPGSTLVPDGEVTQYFPTIGIIEIRMPVGYVTLLDQKVGGADVNPDQASNE